MTPYETAKERAEARRIRGHWVIDDDSTHDALVQQGYTESQRERRRGVLWILMTKQPEVTP